MVLSQAAQNIQNMDNAQPVKTYPFKNYILYVHHTETCMSYHVLCHGGMFLSNTWCYNYFDTVASLHT